MRDGGSHGQRRSAAAIVVLRLLTTLRWLAAIVTIGTTRWTLLLFIASTKLNLNRYQTPGELVVAFGNAFGNAFGPAGAEWRTVLGFASPPIRGEMLLTIVAIAAAYFVVMSAFYAWCGMHPKHDELSRAFVARTMRSGSVRDTATPLRQADSMLRTGRPAETEKAMRQAAVIEP